MKIYEFSTPAPGIYSPCLLIQETATAVPNEG